jgi:phage I-like protein
MKGLIFSVAQFLDAQNDDGGAPWINPATLTYEQRRELLAAVHSGELVAARFRARAFIDKPNVNRTRPEPGRLGELAEKCVGRPLNDGHWGGTYAIVGTMLGGEVEDFEGNDSLVIDHEVTEPRTLAAFIRGERRLFSISLRAARWECSLCNTRARLSWWGPEFGCEHNSRTAELFGRGPINIIHNAFVGSPAVDGTAILAAYADAQEHGVSLFGLTPNYLGQYGEALSSVLTDALDEKVESGDMTRDELVEEIATASGETVERIEEILSGEGDLPTLDTLRAFADTLEIDWQTILDAFETDGGEVPDEDEDDGGDDEEPTEDEPGEEDDEMGQNSELNKLRAELAASEKRREKAENAAFNAAFKQAVSERRVLPTEKTDFQEMAKQMGVEFTQKRLSGRPQIGALQGAPSSSQTPPKASGEAGEWALAELMAKRGKVRPAVLKALKEGKPPVIASQAKD